MGAVGHRRGHTWELGLSRVYICSGGGGPADVYTDMDGQTLDLAQLRYNETPWLKKITGPFA